MRYASVWATMFSTPIRAGSLVALAIVVAAMRSPIVGFSLFLVVGLVRALPTAVDAFSHPAKDRDRFRSRAWRRPVITIADGIGLAVLLPITLRAGIQLL